MYIVHDNVSDVCMYVQPAGSASLQTNREYRQTDHSLLECAVMRHDVLCIRRDARRLDARSVVFPKERPTNRDKFQLHQI